MAPRLIRIVARRVPRVRVLNINPSLLFNDQVLCLPAMGRVVRVSSPSVVNRFTNMTQENVSRRVVETQASPTRMVPLGITARFHIRRAYLKSGSASSPSDIILRLVETLCLMCLKACKTSNSHFCSQKCTDDADKKGPLLLEVPVGHVTFKSGVLCSTRYPRNDSERNHSGRSVQGFLATCGY